MLVGYCLFGGERVGEEEEEEEEDSFECDIHEMHFT